MTSSARVDLSPGDVAQLVDDIAGAFLNSRAVPAPAGTADVADVVACVHVSGAFTGSVICSATEAFATFCAAQMLGIGSEDVDDEALVDAIGEVANMVGGSVKALLPEPSTLSLPLVSVGGSRVLTVPGTTAIASVDLVCAGQPVRIEVLSRA